MRMTRYWLQARTQALFTGTSPRREVASGGERKVVTVMLDVARDPTIEPR
jgi:hypothetical protein